MNKSAKKLQIHWVVQGLESDGEGGWTSGLASNRYRVLKPAEYLISQGHQVSFIPVEQWREGGHGTPDVVLIGKLLPSAGADAYQNLANQVLTQVQRVRQSGIPIVADFNDDHFQHPFMGAYWRSLAQMSTVSVVGTTEMSGVVKQYADRPIQVIGDPLCSPASTARVFHRKSRESGLLRRLLKGMSEEATRLKLVWYGNAVNWTPLQGWMAQIAPLRQQQPFVLWAMTRVTPAMQNQVAQFNQQYGPDAVIELQDWNEEDQWDSVRDADVVLIPSHVQDPTKRVKTSNRLTDALHMGRAVVASPLPSYLPFMDGAWLTDQPAEALRDLMAAPDIALRKIQRGQALALDMCAPERIGIHWLETIQQAIEIPLTVTSAIPTVAVERVVPLIRLNLGCGDKILPGYVNVDVVEARSGKKPDVLCDLHHLKPFPDNHADEVMAIHVVEHFWRWEVEAVLREWVRVMKPGGCMILECPNLVSACEEFLKNPDMFSREDQAGQKTMWVFYGDPSWKDPYMIHRWGYTPNSLKKLMESVGLINVQQAPAQYKLKEPRDMRLVGYKAMQ